ncbi:TetR/AcrR family transcriptional regulator [Denitratisoma oestradiolicum]|uniref:Putative Regulatory protein TetR n=1 Tax=Denitratisoma oestradiolicum TaxID=311182 RepID=A0A6S6XX72_9PROT|nr:TetR/AcrR family transcriptional regulator [Denitratisoma oestradiolicum]TWO81984.1 hypothetical protein CBW56_00650 [Denitratisoma oestradiolicum]CAB1368895.1 putative Regulatory protein TetR [Denitratisoma oestradiolicum]
MQKKTVRKKLGRPEGAGGGIETRRKIIIAAVDCFAERGYANSNNQDIAKAAGITSGALYHYFESKAALYREALQLIVTTLVGTYRAACDQNPDRTSIDQLCIGLREVMVLSRSWPGALRFAAASFSEIQRNSELDWLNEMDARLFYDFFYDLVERAKLRGELAPGANVESVVKVLIVCNMGISSLAEQGEDIFLEAVTTFEQLIAGSLMKRPHLA